MCQMKNTWVVCGVVGLLELIVELVVVDGAVLVVLVVVSGPGPQNIPLIFGGGRRSQTTSCF